MRRQATYLAGWDTVHAAGNTSRWLRGPTEGVQAGRKDLLGLVLRCVPPTAGSASQR